MRQRWLSRRGLCLHLALVLWSPGCLFAGWWQVTRAFGGNGLSYLYSVEWPVFAIVGVWAWWMLLHTDPETVGLAAQRRMELPVTVAGPIESDRDETCDPELEAYNEHLVRLAARGPQTWKNR